MVFWGGGNKIKINVFLFGTIKIKVLYLYSTKQIEIMLVGKNVIGKTGEKKGITGIIISLNEENGKVHVKWERGFSKTWCNTNYLNIL